MSYVTKPMVEKLEKWLSEHFAVIIETTGTKVCRLKFKRGKISRDIAIAFTRYIHSDDPAEYIIADAGYVLTVPSFWLSIPKELVVPYLLSYIEGYLGEYVFKSNSSGSGNNSGNNGNGNGCKPPMHNKPPQNCPVKPPMPPVPPMPPGVLPMDDCEICDDGEVKGYYVNPPSNKGSFNNVIKTDQ